MVVKEKSEEVFASAGGAEEVSGDTSRYHRHGDEESYEHLMTNYQMAVRIVYSLPVEVILGLFSLLCTWSLLSLTCFHALLISLAQTTNERVRGVYQYGGVENPDDLGCCRNWSSVLCGRSVLSKLPDFSQVAKLPEGSGEESVWVDWKVDESLDADTN